MGIRTHQSWKSTLTIGLQICACAVAQVPQPVPNNPCELPRKLDPSLWQEMKLDDYILSYPNGSHTSVMDFARQSGAVNFNCGIGEKCNIGELCHPVQGPAWYVLYAVQEWNLFVNSIYTAVATTMDLVQVTTASLLMDLTEPNDQGPSDSRSIYMLELLGALCTSLSLGVFFSFASLASTSAWLTLSAISGFFAIGSTVTLTGFQAMHMVDQQTGSRQSAFSKWSRFAFYFSQWEDMMHQRITSGLNATLQTGVSSLEPSGLIHFLGNGTFLQSHSRKTTAEIELGLKDVTQVRALVIMLRSMNAFVTRASDPCTSRGLNGAWDGDDYLSYCGPDKIMMNIIIADEKHAKNTLYNAKTIALNYNITTQYLTESSWHCQQQYGLGAYPYANTAMPMDITSDCVANLPVCDCSRPDIRKAIKKHGTVRACRKVGGLPI